MVSSHHQGSSYIRLRRNGNREGCPDGYLRFDEWRVGNYPSPSPSNPNGKTIDLNRVFFTPSWIQHGKHIRMVHEKTTGKLPTILSEWEERLAKGRFADIFLPHLSETFKEELETISINAMASSSSNPADVNADSSKRVEPEGGSDINKSNATSKANDSSSSSSSPGETKPSVKMDPSGTFKIPELPPPRFLDRTLLRLAAAERNSVIGPDVAGPGVWDP